MNSRVPVEIEWSGAVGMQSLEAGFTRVVNGYGCLLVSPREAELKQKLRLLNLVNREAADGVVVWKGTKRPDGWDLGIELVAANLDFWGVDL